VTGAAPGPDPAAVARAVDVVAIGQLAARYGDVVTRRAWGELPSLFAPGCPVTLDLRGGRVLELAGADDVGSFVAASVERFAFFEFAVLNHVVDVAGDRATGRLYLWELRQEAATATWTNAYGVYQDDYARLDGRWVFARRRYASLARGTADAMEVFEVPPVAPG
jgi:hypothetical protein